ncbi:unnamed protein product [Orchesella dallaii]|uniref:Integrin alpha-2 domain-containing protein n=1 Tax=Orchesella dallaii TaxID=48710 RepID=A0ABP1QXW3_9HEXA
MLCEPEGFSFSGSRPEVESKNISSPILELLQLKDNNASPTSFSVKDKVIILPSCKSSGKPSQSCRKVTCFMDLPSMKTRAIRIQMYLLPEAVNRLISDDSDGISVPSQVSVSFLNITASKDGETTRRFLKAKGVATWELMVAAGGGILLLLLLAFILFRCGFFQRKAKEQLSLAKRQTQLNLTNNDADGLLLQNDDEDVEQVDHTSPI